VNVRTRPVENAPSRSVHIGVAVRE
jgi:hypothetical protein